MKKKFCSITLTLLHGENQLRVTERERERVSEMNFALLAIHSRDYLQ